MKLYDIITKDAAEPSNNYSVQVYEHLLQAHVTAAVEEIIKHFEIGDTLEITKAPYILIVERIS